jgi:hypothetical protein
MPLNLSSQNLENRSSGQTGVILELLNNQANKIKCLLNYFILFLLILFIQTNGFFVECGALNGEYMSNTIDLERKFNWSGVLIEANPETFKHLFARNRKAWTLPICLSLEPFPTKVSY